VNIQIADEPLSSKTEPNPTAGIDLTPSRLRGGKRKASGGRPRGGVGHRHRAGHQSGPALILSALKKDK